VAGQTFDSAIQTAAEQLSELRPKTKISNLRLKSQI